MPKTSDKSKEPATIEFESIPCVKGNGYTALNIYPPSTFFGGKMFSVHVGGCGVGSASKRDAAERVLLECAIATLDRRIAKAQEIVAHYTIQKHKLMTAGLVKVEK